MTREDLWLVLFKRQNGRCPECDERFTSQRRPTQKWLRSRFINIDHRRPKSHGGSDDLANLQLMHKPCNSRKGNRCEGCPVCKPELHDTLPMWNDSDDVNITPPDYYVHKECTMEYCPGTDVPHER